MGTVEDNERKFYQEIIIRLLDREDEHFKQILGTIQNISGAIIPPIIQVAMGMMTEKYRKQQQQEEEEKRVR